MLEGVFAIRCTGLSVFLFAAVSKPEPELESTAKLFLVGLRRAAKAHVVAGLPRAQKEECLV